MDNRDRDKVSRNSTGPTDAGNVNRDVASRRGQEEHIEPVDFGQNIGESENLEPNTRRNDEDTMRRSQPANVDISGRSEGNH